MHKPFVYLLALLLPAVLAADTFKVRIDRDAHLGATMLPAGEYKVNIEGGKAEFRMGEMKVMADVKEEKLPAKARQGFVRYSNGADNQIAEIVRKGSEISWRFN